MRNSFLSEFSLGVGQLVKACGMKLFEDVTFALGTCDGYFSLLPDIEKKEKESNNCI